MILNYYNKFLKDVDLEKNNDGNVELSDLEKLKLERDLKRRRKSFRKKVSTKNKSYTEVINYIILMKQESFTF